MTPALAIRDLRKHFGGISVLTGASFDVMRGSITALIGSNGTGKSTLLNVVTGLLREDNGEIRLDGRNLRGVPAYARARLGLARTFQLTRAFGSFTVAEAVELAATSPGDERFGRSLMSVLGLGVRPVRPTRAILEQCLLDRIADSLCGALSYGQTKLLMLAQAIATNGSVLCLDELCAGLEPAVVAHVGQVLRGLASDGKTILFIEHNLQLVRDLATHTVFLHQGKTHREGPTAAVLEDPDVVRLYLGQ